MSQILLFFLLFAMSFPAFFSLLFATRSWFFMLWNFFWYWVMGSVLNSAIDDPRAYYLSLGLMLMYVWIVLKRPRFVAAESVFRFYGTRRVFHPPFSQPNDSSNKYAQTNSNHQPNLEDNVLDAEFKKL